MILVGKSPGHSNQTTSIPVPHLRICIPDKNRLNCHVKPPAKTANGQAAEQSSRISAHPSTAPRCSNTRVPPSEQAASASQSARGNSPIRFKGSRSKRLLQSFSEILLVNRNICRPQAINGLDRPPHILLKP
jgi:hypothetical protein